MRVVLISGEYPPLRGGLADYTRLLAVELHGIGVEVAVLTSAQAAPGEEGFPVWPVVSHWGFATWPKIARAVQGAQICHLQYQTAAYSMNPAINLLPLWLGWRSPGLRFIVTFHDLRVPYLFPKAGRLRPWANWALAKLSHAVVATNREDEESLKARGLHSHLIPIGSNITPSPSPGFQRGEWRARHREVGVVSYFGLINASKGVDTLLRAVARLREGGTAVKLVMVGETVGASDPTNRAYLERVKRLIEELGLEGAVEWTGWLPPQEVSAHLMASDLCALPYRDGASYRRGSLMAALAHGLPIVTTQRSSDGGTLPPLIDSQNCLLVPPDDPEALAQAIAQLLASPQLRDRLAEGARSLGAAFSWPEIARKTLQLYQEVAQ